MSAELPFPDMPVGADVELEGESGDGPLSGGQESRQWRTPDVIR
ncbi:hypothetical protein ACFWAY_50730 [Rhodococcus sp. NPDC059968]